MSRGNVAPKADARYVSTKTLLLCALFLLPIVSFLSLYFGAVSVSLSEIVSYLSGDTLSISSMILHELRVPRVLLAIGIGALLASCGAVTQGLFRNPLADPFLIGVGAGATAGASVTIVLMAQIQGDFLGLSFVSLGALIGGAIAVFFVHRLSSSPEGTSVATMLLAGVAITFLAGSLSSILEFFADNDMLRRLSFWKMGGLDTANYSSLTLVAITCCIVFILLPRYARILDALLLGESEARHLGIDTTRVKTQLILIVAAGVGVSVAVAGTIAFIGLIVPHMVRSLIGPSHRYLLPISALTGGILLVVADAFSRTVIAPSEIPVGFMTSLIGVPVFISLLTRRRSYVF
ncbi:MAG: iron ABC transporter permease [Agarilytica sp.]